MEKFSSNRVISLFNIKNFSFLNQERSNKSYLFSFIANHLIVYPTPITLTYAWSFGFLAGMCLVVQMVSGIFLAMHYTPHVDLAFSSVEYIMRDGAGSSVLVCLIFLICSTSCIRVFQTLYRKRSTGRKQVYCDDYSVLHKPLVISEYRLRLREMSSNRLKPAIADLQANFRL
jgi:hypothetical protein